MKNSFKYLKTLSLAISLLVFLNSCSNDDEGPQTEEPVPGLKMVSNTEFGNILVNQDNQSLYFFANDISGESFCKGGCAAVWPPLTGEVYDFELSAGLNASDFSTITREDGLKQVTYKGWPLYYFSPEGDGVLEEPGEILGDGKNDVFYVAKPDYSIMVGKQPVEEGKDALIYLVDDRGVSLYLNNNDEQDISNCAGGCAEVWPPFKTPASLILPSLLETYDFATVTREDDLGPQLAVFGSPLYYFTPDEQTRGNVLGQAGGPAQSFFVVEPI
jgi:predicted lipoprotein with Yx(FWY)xxD motif